MPLPIETERLMIRRFAPEDLDDEMEYMSDPEEEVYSITVDEWRARGGGSP